MPILKGNNSFYLLPFFLFLIACQTKPVAEITGVLKVGQPLTITFDGPMLTEKSEDNPFLNYRLDVLFTQSSESFKVPGYYAADGIASESSAEKGNKWRVHFTPPTEGEWQYNASFKKGKKIAISADDNSGTAVDFNGASGTILIKKIDERASGFYSKGKLIYTGERYLRHGKNGAHFIKGGTGSPENLLGYIDFDGTVRNSAGEQRSGEAFTTDNLHKYEPHLKDWKTGDPSWQNGKGKSLIGGLNYLASKGTNTIYFLLMNINGDGKDVWPYTAYDERYRFDCSKLDQWNIVFDHMDRLGIHMNMFLQETENETLLDKGNTGPERKIYIREMIARFGHHLGLTWNMGEENGPVHWSPDGQSTAQQKAMIQYFQQLDPYENLVVIHSHSDMGSRREMFTKLLEDKNLEGISIQINPRQGSHDETKYWVETSAANGHQWVVPIDEIGHASRGLDPDDRLDNNQDSVRREVLWGNLMAGGAGVEWYFGYKNSHNDLQCEDWRSRDRFWDVTRIALDFFNDHLPFADMMSKDDLVTSNNGWCLAKRGDIYAIYLKDGGKAELDLSQAKGTFSVRWFNPRKGGNLIDGPITKVNGGGVVDLGAGPDVEDWVCLVQLII